MHLFGEVWRGPCRYRHTRDRHLWGDPQNSICFVRRLEAHMCARQLNKPIPVRNFVFVRGRFCTVLVGDNISPPLAQHDVLARGFHRHNVVAHDDEGKA